MAGRILSSFFASSRSDNMRWALFVSHLEFLVEFEQKVILDDSDLIIWHEAYAGVVNVSRGSFILRFLC